MSHAARALGEATLRIAWLSLLSLALILLLRYTEFRSVRQALLVMVNLPLALVGGVFEVVVTGGVVDIATLASSRCSGSRSGTASSWFPTTTCCARARRSGTRSGAGPWSG